MTEAQQGSESSYDDRGSAEDDLEHAAEGVRDVLGYGVVAISRLRDTGEFEYVAVVGPQDARDYLLRTHLAGSQMRTQRDVALVEGRVHYIPRGTATSVGPRWAPDIPPTDDAGVWHPADELFVLLVDAEGEVCGHVAVDGPPGGRVPTADDRRRLQAYVDRMVPGVLRADALLRVDDQLRIAAQARGVVRRAIARLDESELFDACAAELAECLRADQVWFRTETTETTATAETTEGFRQHPPTSPDVTAGLGELLGRMAREAWSTQQAVVVEHERVLPTGTASEGWETVLEHLRDHDLESLLLAPVGAGAECLGMIVAVRDTGADEWSDLEVVAAQDLGRDLGSALQTARVFERERGHAAYKQQLIATIAHELKNPLTAVRGNLELLEDELAGREGAAVALAHRIGRASDRLSVLVGNLLTLSEVDDARDGARRRPVQLGVLVADAVEVMADQAEGRGVELAAALSPDVVVDGIPGELEHLVVNLLSNAVKYSDPHGRVEVSLALEGAQAVLRVADAGIGIAADEIDRIFTEFFRSADPAARRRPGTGLGLAIAARVVDRHGAHIEVDSTPGLGTTFTVRLPLSPSPDDPGRPPPTSARNAPATERV